MGKEPFVHWVIAHRSLSFISSHSREWRVGEPKIALAAIAGQWPFFATVASRSTVRLKNICGARSAWATMGQFFRLGSCCALLFSESRFRSFNWLQLTYHFCTLCRSDKRTLSNMCIHMVFLFRLRLPHFTRLKFIRYACILGLIKSRHSQLRYVLSVRSIRGNPFAEIPTAFRTFSFSSVDHWYSGARDPRLKDEFAVPDLRWVRRAHLLHRRLSRQGSQNFATTLHLSNYIYLHLSTSIYI